MPKYSAMVCLARNCTKSGCNLMFRVLQPNLLFNPRKEKENAKIKNTPYSTYSMNSANTIRLLR